MDVKKFVLSYYKNATDDFYISRIDRPQEALRLHSHGYYQINYVRRGKLIHHLQNGAASLIAGDVFILPPDLAHYIENTPEGVEFYSLSFMPGYFSPEKESNRLLLDFLLFLKRQPGEYVQTKISLSYGDAAFAEALMSRILAEFEGRETGKDELIRECLSALLSLFARAYFENGIPSLSAETRRGLVAHCIEYVNVHFKDRITLEEMARLSSMSKASFCSLFKTLTGQTFKEYLSRIRIEKVSEMIRNGEKVSVAALASGYDDFSTFYRNFKKFKGVSPGSLSQSAPV